MTFKKCSYCCGLNGQKKNIYPSVVNAMDAIRYIQSNNPNVYLKYYKCPKGNGYHLTEKM